MKTFAFEYLSLFLFITSALMVIYGWLSNIEGYSNFGAFLFLFSQIGSTTIAIIVLKNTKEGNSNESEPQKTTIETITSILQSTILFLGLGGMLFENSLYKTPGQIIWFGSIAIYVFGGIFISFVTDIPLRMTYGGWRVKYKKTRK